MHTPLSYNTAKMRVVSENGPMMSLKDPQGRIAKACQKARLACIEVVNTFRNESGQEELAKVCGHTAKICERTLVAIRANDLYALDDCIEACEKAIEACKGVDHEVCEECIEDCSKCMSVCGDFAS